MELSLVFIFLIKIIETRDNSTGFCIQWGRTKTNIDLNLPRSFWSALIAVSIHSDVYGSTIPIRLDYLNNNKVKFLLSTSEDENNIHFIALGFS